MSQAHNEVLRLEQVGIRYSQQKKGFKRPAYWALKDISFSIHEGETVGIIGRNGVGKTTLLRLLSDIIRPDRGRMWRKPGLRTALLSLQVGFIPTLTGRQNAILSGITLGLSRKYMEAHIEAIMAFSELGTFADQPLASYSTGMWARLGFSVAYQINPDVLLIDEVISVGDAPFRKKSAEIIHNRVKANGTTIIVTHDPQIARTLCDRLIWVDDGTVRMAGAGAEVLKAYQTG